MKSELDEATAEVVEPRILKLSSTVRFASTDRLTMIEKKDADTIPTDLTFSPFEITGFLTPIDGDIDRGLRIDLGNRQVTALRADILKTQDLITWLGAHGVRFAAQHVGKIAQYVAGWHGDEITAYTRNGWQSNGAFVVGEQIIGGEGCVIRTAYNQIPFAQRGTFEEWQSNVLPHIRKKPGWLFATLVALSSPILHIVGATSGTVFNLTGLSSTGKTDGLKCGIGVWGKPTDKGTSACLQSFRTTLNGIESIAVQSNHIALTLDEMKSADEEVVKEGGYLLGNGRGKIRSKPDGTQREVSSWLVNTLVCGERTAEGLFDAGEGSQAAGQVIRWLDIDSDPLMPMIPYDEVRAFGSAILEHYGTAGPELIRRILDRDDVVRLFLDAALSLYHGEDARLQRIAQSFAPMIVVGEIMGIEAGIVREVFERLLTEGVEEALDDFRQMGEEMLDFIDAKRGSSIVELVEDDGEWDDETGEKNSYRDRDGWFDPSEDCCYLTAKTMKRFFVILGRNKCYDWMDRKGVVRSRGEQGGRTMQVPILKRGVSAVRIDVEALRKAVG